MDAYRVLKQIGKGSYGQVFLVKHNISKKQYVVKKIKLTASSAKERLAAEQEASLLSSLHHPNIVSYKESFQDSHGVLHIVMGYCEGGDLCTRLKGCGGQLLPETQVVEWFVQIALALQYLHDRKILHRDLKTQNIFLSKNDIIKVGDLGIARVLDGSCELANTVIGTPYYMSPELFSNQPYDHKSDIWALGCCVYEMATLKHAFTARNINALMYKILQGKVPPLPGKFSTELSQLVQLMMSLKAKDRPSVHQILRMTFVRGHIKMFLDRTASKRKKLKPPAHPQTNTTNAVGSGSGRGSSGKESKEGGRGRERRSSIDRADGVRRRSSSASAGSTAQTRETPESVEKCYLEQPRPNCEGRSSSLTQLPQQQQQEGEGEGEGEGERGKVPDAATSQDKEQKQKKVPRPLPPNPIPKSESSPLPVVSHKPPSVGKGGVSSARERRRRNKQEGGRGRVVLKSRSAADLCKKEDKIKEEVDFGSPPGNRGEIEKPDKSRIQKESSNLDKNEREPNSVVGTGQPDLGVVADRDKGNYETGSGHTQPMKEVNKDNGDTVTSSRMERVDSQQQQPQQPQQQRHTAVSVGQKVPRTRRVKSDSDRTEEVAGNGRAVVAELNGQSSDEVEVEEFFTLLDTTLHLPDSPLCPAPFDSEDRPGPPLAAFSVIDHSSREEEGEHRQRTLPPGRLADRIKALREECIRELGEPVMKEAYHLLDEVDPEQAEEVLFGLLGKDAAFSFTGKLQQLKLCEDSLYEL